MLLLNFRFLLETQFFLQALFTSTDVTKKSLAPALLLSFCIQTLKHWTLFLGEPFLSHLSQIFLFSILPKGQNPVFSFLMPSFYVTSRHQRSKAIHITTTGFDDEQFSWSSCSLKASLMAYIGNINLKKSGYSVCITDSLCCTPETNTTL